MPNGTGPIPERPVEFAVIRDGICITSGQYKGFIKVGTVHYWLSRKPDSPHYWENNTERPDETMVAMTTDVWDKCKDEGKYKYSDQVQGWVDKEEMNWRWDGQGGEYIFLSIDFVP